MAEPNNNPPIRQVLRLRGCRMVPRNPPIHPHGAEPARAIDDFLLDTSDESSDEEFDDVLNDDFLLDGESEEEAEVVNQETANLRLESIIQDLQSAAKVANERAEMAEKESCDLKEQVEGIMDRMQSVEDKVAKIETKNHWETFSYKSD